VFARELRVQSIARDRKGDKGDDNSLKNLENILEKEEQADDLCTFCVANAVREAL